MAAAVGAFSCVLTVRLWLVDERSQWLWKSAWGHRDRRFVNSSSCISIIRWQCEKPALRTGPAHVRCAVLGNEKEVHREAGSGRGARYAKENRQDGASGFQGNIQFHTPPRRRELSCLPRVLFDQQKAKA